ncbi:MAG: hypothetical protein OXU36_11315 [Candidatus Poribacteria bacterium]|nr:hypothetical protein [Candidatus Poribacteria bacterium]
MNLPPDEKLTRFIFDRDGFAPCKGIVRFKAFMPPKVSKGPPIVYSPDLSVCRRSVISGCGVLPEDKVWEIGLTHVHRPGRRLKARADFTVGDIYENNLQVVPDPQPFKEHANITPFPPDELGCLRLATKLAHVSKLEIMPPAQTDS